jgi:hypothetical protein
MANLKILKSVAHNLAHSYLSLENYIDDDYTVERFFKIATSHNQSFIIVDLLNKTIEPKFFQEDKSINKSLDYWSETLNRLLSAEGLSKDHIKSTKIKVNLSTKECISEIVDQNGKIHIAKLNHWFTF